MLISKNTFVFFVPLDLGVVSCGEEGDSIQNLIGSAGVEWVAGTKCVMLSAENGRSWKVQSTFNTSRWIILTDLYSFRQ